MIGVVGVIVRLFENKNKYYYFYPCTEVETQVESFETKVDFDRFSKSINWYHSATTTKSIIKR